MRSRRSAHLGVQLLLHVGAAGCRQKVVEHDEGVTLQIEGQVVAATPEKVLLESSAFNPQRSEFIPDARGRPATPAWRPNLAATKAPKIMVKTVSLTDVEKLFLRERN